MSSDRGRLFERALEIWKRDGPEALHEFVWALNQEEQLVVGIEAFNGREIAMLAASFPDDFEQDMAPTGIPGMGLFRGPAGYLRMLREWLEVFPDARLELESVEEHGDVALALIEQRVSGSGSHVPVAFEYANVYAVDSGRPVRAEFHTDLAVARARYEKLIAERTQAQSRPSRRP